MDFEKWTGNQKQIEKIGNAENEFSSKRFLSLKAGFKNSCIIPDSILIKRGEDKRIRDCSDKNIASLENGCRFRFASTPHSSLLIPNSNKKFLENF